MPVRITVEQFAPISRQGGFDLIDVRTPDEFYELHAVGALMMPLDGLNPRAIMESRGDRAGEPLYIICRSGSRSILACGLFEKAGFTNVISIEGGTQAWQAAGLPVNRGLRRPISIDRQIRLAAGLCTCLGSLAAAWQPWCLLLPGLGEVLGVARESRLRVHVVGRVLRAQLQLLLPRGRRGGDGGC